MTTHFKFCRHYVAIVHKNTYRMLVDIHLELS